MCLIQSYHFTRSGQVEWGSCSLTQNDNIAVEVITTFSGSELGKQYSCNANIKRPDGNTVNIFIGTQIATSTNTFTGATWTTPVAVGNWQIMSVTIADSATGVIACQG